ncbi:hypothetical protein OSTOST_01659, partial [Ostertagia ostertagi]
MDPVDDSFSSSQNAVPDAHVVNSVQLLILRETWFHSKTNMAPLLGVRKRGGGVAVMVKSPHSACIVFSESVPDSYESLTCDIWFYSLEIRLLILRETWFHSKTNMAPLLGVRKRGGGVAVMVKSPHSACIVFSESVPDSYESLTCDIWFYSLEIR